MNASHMINRYDPSIGYFVGEVHYTYVNYKKCISMGFVSVYVENDETCL